MAWGTNRAADTKRDPMRTARPVPSRLCAVVALSLALNACSPSGGHPDQPGSWLEPSTYSYVLDSRCGERSLLGRFAIDIRRGDVTAARALDSAATRMITLLGDDPIPTLGELIVEAQVAREGGARVEVLVDPADGHPTSITLDWGGDDAQACYSISDYTTSR